MRKQWNSYRIGWKIQGLLIWVWLKTNRILSGGGRGVKSSILKEFFKVEENFQGILLRKTNF